MPKRAPLIIGIGLSIMAIFLINMYVIQQRKSMENSLKRSFQEKYKNMVAVMVAGKDIPRGAIIDSGMLETKVIPNKFVEPSAVTSLDRVAGMKVAVPIHKGEQITLNKLITVARARGESLAMATPVGKRAITISVDQISGLSGMIKPGDYVDVIAILTIPVKGATQATQTIPLFQKVLVLAVGNKLIAGGSKNRRRPLISFGSSRSSSSNKKGNFIITLALYPRQASLLSFVAQQGIIRLVMRSPADAKVQPIPPANWQTLFQYIDSTLPKQPQPVVKEPKKIEVYRGLKKSYITISK